MPAATIERPGGALPCHRRSREGPSSQVERPRSRPLCGRAADRPPAALRAPARWGLSSGIRFDQGCGLGRAEGLDAKQARFIPKPGNRPKQNKPTRPVQRRVRVAAQTLKQPSCSPHPATVADDVKSLCYFSGREKGHTWRRATNRKEANIRRCAVDCARRPEKWQLKGI